MSECKWVFDCDDLEGDSWFTECGERHLFFDGTPKTNGYKFCPYCGKPLKSVNKYSRNPNNLRAKIKEKQ